VTDTQANPQLSSPATTNRLEPAVRTLTVVDAPADASRRVAVGLLVALVLLGGGLRLAAMLQTRCLWLDEAMLALNLVERSPRQLLEPLDWNQGAPVGFLLAVKGSISAFGASEWALRLVPFVASLAAVVCFAVMARRLLPAGAALLAVALFALSPYLISYAAECKQYGCDAAVAIGLLAVSVGLLEGKGGAARWAALAVTGAVAVWCSHPATFVLGAIGSALLLHALVEKDRARFLAASAAVACWLVSFGACYVLCLKQLGGNKYLTDYWIEHFMPLSPGAASWAVDHLIAFFTTPGGLGGTYVPLGGFAAFLALVGLYEFARERWAVAVALAGPVAFLMAASAVQKYPFGGRLLLFLIPFAVLLTARGAGAVYDALRDRHRFAAVALLVLLVGAGAWHTYDELKRPMRREQIAPVLAQLQKEIRPGDKVFVYYSAVPAYLFYTRDNPLPVPAEAVTFGVEHRDDPAAYRAEVEQLHGRVWVVFSHPHKHEETMLRTMLEDRAPLARKIREPGAAAWLHDIK
jgi:4-amino-4-deoxy-L-arabinose transferase-like glycosyltransferase